MSAPGAAAAQERRWTWGQLAVTLALGLVGGSLAALANAPLAWMIGAMASTTIAGARLAMAPGLRSSMIAVLGVMLGSSFKPHIFDQAGEWVASLAFLGVYIFVIAFVLWALLRRFTSYDNATAYFAAVPGGFNEMVMIGSAMGGDDRILALSHAARVLFVVLSIPFWFKFFAGYSSGGFSSGWGWGDPLDLLLLLGCAAVGAPVATRLKLPAGALVGPMLLSAAVHMTGLTNSSPPGMAVAAAQVIVGSGIGTRFTGVPIRQVRDGLFIAFLLTVVMLAITLLFALGLHAMTGIPITVLVLAYAPGGLAEMSLIGLFIGADTAFVATHHIVRIFLIISLAPLAFRLIKRLDAAMTKN